MARDVYNALYALWGQPTFQNIAASEQAHMDAVKTLFVRYGITVPQNAPGVFSDASLQTLYNSLMSAGSPSLADALKVGATIEEVDIADLQTRLARTTDTSIQKVYSDLMNGSYNHLRTFVSVLNRLTGEVYQPQYLSSDLYQTILASTNGNRFGQGGTDGANTTRMTGQGMGGSTTTTQGTRTGTDTCTSTGTIGGRGTGYRGGRR
jgi:rubrerythrin